MGGNIRAMKELPLVLVHEMCWCILGGSLRIDNPMVNAYHTFLQYKSDDYDRVDNQCKSIAHLMVTSKLVAAEVRSFLRKDKRIGCLRMVLWKDLFYRLDLWSSITISDEISKLCVETVWSTKDIFKVNGEITSTDKMLTRVKLYLKDILSRGEMHTLRCIKFKGNACRVFPLILLENLDKIK